MEKQPITEIENKIELPFWKRKGTPTMIRSGREQGMYEQAISRWSGDKVTIYAMGATEQEAIKLANEIVFALDNLEKTK